MDRADALSSGLKGRMLECSMLTARETLKVQATGETDGRALTREFGNRKYNTCKQGDIS